jgi:hypothetical protein
MGILTLSWTIPPPTNALKRAPPMLPLLTNIRALIVFPHRLVPERLADGSNQLMDKDIIERLTGTLEPIYMNL